MEPRERGRLYHIKADGSQMTPFIIKKRVLYIGSGDSCGIRLYTDGIFPEHCTIKTEKKGKVYLEPLHPTALVLVNHKKIDKKCLLKQNDIITILMRSFRFAYPIDSVHCKVSRDSTTVSKHKISAARKSVSPKKKVNPNVDDNLHILRVKRPASGIGIDETKARKKKLSISEKKVRFGPPLTPEEFDKHLPPASPLRRGSLPGERSLQKDEHRKLKSRFSSQFSPNVLIRKASVKTKRLSSDPQRNSFPLQSTKRSRGSPLGDKSLNIANECSSAFIVNAEVHSGPISKIGKPIENVHSPKRKISFNCKETEDFDNSSPHSVPCVSKTHSSELISNKNISQTKKSSNMSFIPMPEENIAQLSPALDSSSFKSGKNKISEPRNDIVTFCQSASSKRTPSKSGKIGFHKKPLFSDILKKNSNKVSTISKVTSPKLTKCMKKTSKHQGEHLKHCEMLLHRQVLAVGSTGHANSPTTIILRKRKSAEIDISDLVNVKLSPRTPRRARHILKRETLPQNENLQLELGEASSYVQEDNLKTNNKIKSPIEPKRSKIYKKETSKENDCQPNLFNMETKEIKEKVVKKNIEEISTSSKKTRKSKEFVTEESFPLSTREIPGKSVDLQTETNDKILDNLVKPVINLTPSQQRKSRKSNNQIVKEQESQLEKSKLEDLDILFSKSSDHIVVEKSSGKIETPSRITAKSKELDPETSCLNTNKIDTDFVTLSTKQSDQQVKKRSIDRNSTPSTKTRKSNEILLQSSTSLGAQQGKAKEIRKSLEGNRTPSRKTRKSSEITPEESLFLDTQESDQQVANATTSRKTRKSSEIVPDASLDKQESAQHAIRKSSEKNQTPSRKIRKSNATETISSLHTQESDKQATRDKIETNAIPSRNTRKSSEIVPETSSLDTLKSAEKAIMEISERSPTPSRRTKNSSAPETLSSLDTLESNQQATRKSIEANTIPSRKTRKSSEIVPVTSSLDIQENAYQAVGKDCEGNPTPSKTRKSSAPEIISSLDMLEREAIRKNQETNATPSRKTRKSSEITSEERSLYMHEAAHQSMKTGMERKATPSRKTRKSSEIAPETSSFDTQGSAQQVIRKSSKGNPSRNTRKSSEITPEESLSLDTQESAHQAMKASIERNATPSRKTRKSSEISPETKSLDIQESVQFAIRKSSGRNLTPSMKTRKSCEITPEERLSVDTLDGTQQAMRKSIERNTTQSRKKRSFEIVAEISSLDTQQITQQAIRKGSEGNLTSSTTTRKSNATETVSSLDTQESDQQATRKSMETNSIPSRESRDISPEKRSSLYTQKNDQQSKRKSSERTATPSRKTLKSNDFAQEDKSSLDMQEKNQQTKRRSREMKDNPQQAMRMRIIVERSATPSMKTRKSNEIIPEDSSTLVAQANTQQTKSSTKTQEGAQKAKKKNTKGNATLSRKTKKSNEIAPEESSPLTTPKSDRGVKRKGTEAQESSQQAKRRSIERNVTPTKKARKSNEFVPEASSSVDTRNEEAYKQSQSISPKVTKKESDLKQTKKTVNKQPKRGRKQKQIQNESEESALVIDKVSRTPSFGKENEEVKNLQSSINKPRKGRKLLQASPKCDPAENPSKLNSPIMESSVNVNEEKTEQKPKRILKQSKGKRNLMNENEKTPHVEDLNDLGKYHEKKADSKSRRNKETSVQDSSEHITEEDKITEKPIPKRRKVKKDCSEEEVKLNATKLSPCRRVTRSMAKKTAPK